LNYGNLEIKVMGEAIAIIGILEEVAKTIGSIVLQQLGTSPIEKDMNKLYENVKSYHSRTRELLRLKGDPNKLANDIEKDGLFFIYVATEKAQKIVRSFRYLDRLTRRIKRTRKTRFSSRFKMRQEQTQIIQYLLRIFEEIFRAIQSKKLDLSKA